MADDFRSVQREALENKSKELAKQYKAALEQSTYASDATVRVQAEQQAETIDRRILEIHAKLEQIELALPASVCPEDPGRNPVTVETVLAGRLHKIDFRHVARAIRHLLDSECDAGRAGLLLFQRCELMSGRLCAQRIKKILVSEAGGIVHPIELGLQPADCNDPGGLLRRLAGCLNLDSFGLSTPDLLGRVTARICGSMQTGSIVLLQIEFCDHLTHRNPAALHWIVTDLWRALLDDLGRAARAVPGSVTLIATLFFEGEVPEGALIPEHCCCIDDFRRERLLEIELCHWKLSEIEDWLSRCGEFHTCPAAEIRQLAEIVMDASRGIPALIANQLLKQCAAFVPAGARC